jgi:predicted GH43/DUF377 family glycosyl hydrolase
MKFSWQKRGLVYVPEGTLQWSRSHAQVPVAQIIEHGRLRIFYATRDDSNRSNIGYVEVDAEDPQNILVASQEPILSFGRLGAFDEDGLMPSSLITLKGQVFLYYIGWSQRKHVPYQNSIGLAISDDGGRTFHKYSEGPIIGVNHIDPLFTGTIFVLKDGDLLRAYYLSCREWRVVDGKPESMYVLKYATSYDGINWLRNNKIAIPFKSENEGGLASAAVVKLGGLYHMWFGYRNYFDFRSNRANSYNIGFAHSEDGVEWIRDDSRSGIDKSDQGWDSEMISYPYVIKVNGRIYLFYNGNQFGKTGFGYAILNY